MWNLLKLISDEYTTSLSFGHFNNDFIKYL